MGAGVSVRVTPNTIVNAPELKIIMDIVTKLLITKLHKIGPPVSGTLGMNTTTTTTAPIAKDAVVRLRMTNKEARKMVRIDTIALESPPNVISELIWVSWDVDGGVIRGRGVRVVFNRVDNA